MCCESQISRVSEKYSLCIRNYLKSLGIQGTDFAHSCICNSLKLSRRIAPEQVANPAAQLPYLFTTGGWQLAYNLEKAVSLFYYSVPGREFEKLKWHEAQPRT